MRRLLLVLILLLCGRAQAAVTFGSDWASTGSGVTDSITVTATLGSTGANSILFVLLQAESNYSTPSVDYNGTAMTSLGGKVTYSGSVTVYRELFYLNANLTSGQNIHVFSGSPTTLGQSNSKAWHINYFTYGGVSGIGTSSVNATNGATSSSGSPVSVAFNFTPTFASSKMIHLLNVQASNTCGSTYASVFGTVRQNLSWTTMGALATSEGMADYAPGSTTLYSLSQSWNPNYCGESAYGRGVELVDAGGGGGTATFAPTISPSNTPTATPTVSPTNTAVPPATATPNQYSAQTRRRRRTL